MTLRERLEHFGNGGTGDVGATCKEAADVIERLRAALWPFAERHRINAGVCYDDYRRAHEALNEQVAPAKNGE